MKRLICWFKKHDWKDIHACRRCGKLKPLPERPYVTGGPYYYDSAPSSDNGASMPILISPSPEDNTRTLAAIMMLQSQEPTVIIPPIINGPTPPPEPLVAPQSIELERLWDAVMTSSIQLEAPDPSPSPSFDSGSSDCGSSCDCGSSD